MAYFDRFKKGKYKNKSLSGKIWYFIWHEDSIESWLINIVLAFVLIKFIVYPGLGLVLATTHPIVAVVSGSMHHGVGFDEYWQNAGEWYSGNGISKSDFQKFPIHNGFSKGDIMILIGSRPDKLHVGDIIVFQARRPDPIIHRIFNIEFDGKNYKFQTKGDNFRTNPSPIRSPELDELDIGENQVIGKAFIRVPFLGYVKIFAVDFVCIFNDFSFCIRR